ncbi:MAG: D-alanyl-D-alanine carboxypeptidase/D-alanyl-D-alanine-endopeptidase [Planctomycetaceae bacterium]|nr:D-alanyl-D-alanine carboxypeptidase/D-alanyl-D-alanine-endopeptidase [Planctomycetaceae bacterium]
MVTLWQGQSGRDAAKWQATRARSRKREAASAKPQARSRLRLRGRLRASRKFASVGLRWQFRSTTPMRKAVAVFRACFLFLAPLTLGLVSIPAPAAPPNGLAKQLDALIEGPDYKHATWGIVVVNAKTGETVYERNPEAMLAPASVTKLFSCAAALVAIGPDSTAETVVYQRGARVNGTLHGDLILVAAGDLTFGGRTKDGKTVFQNHDHTYANSGLGECALTDTDPLAALNDLAKQVKAAGINQIDGEIAIDDRLFVRTRSSGSGPDAVSPILVNDNLVDILIAPGAKPGDPAKVTTRPESGYYQCDSLVTTSDEKSAASVQLLPVGANQFAVRGKIPVGSKPLLRIYPIDDPTQFARSLFIEALRRNGVKPSAAVLRQALTILPTKDAYAELTKVASFQSPPFREAIAVTLKVSHNLYASTLPCLIAASKGQETVEAGLREERKILEKLGVDVSQISFGGGAGGASADHVTARATVQLLQGMAKRPEWDAYKAGLPIMGVDGTLADVVGADSPVRGKVFAKTGTLVWFDAANERVLLKSKALAGTMTTKAGTPLYLAIFVNNVPLPTGIGPGREGKLLGKLCEILHDAGP